HSLKEKVDGSDLILTLDRAIQFKACQAIADGVKKYEAEAGAAIVINPKTGGILAMCGAPDYDPDDYGNVEDISIYNNTGIFQAYEPGSIFKPITMAAALDLGKLEPETTYEDPGFVQYGPYKIKNFADKVYGKSTMVEVLDNSINTGAIFAMNQIGKQAFTQYVKDFGFGKSTGIELDTESPGVVSNLDLKGDIYAATASFGQGIMATPLQMVRAYSVFANAGKMVKPYIVSQIISPEGEVESFSPQEAGQIVSPKTAMVLGGMLVSVVENGHAKRAAVSGYRVAGKTGTAQVASSYGGYSGNVNVSFVGYAPFSDPKFAMIVVFYKPKNSQEAAISSAPVFADIAKFILQYYNVPHDAPVKEASKS
ncbi:MAG: penicillin-binding protein 2, partial [Patescibacteria group bacterium]